MSDIVNVLINGGIFLASIAGLLLPLHMDNRRQRRAQTMQLNDTLVRIERKLKKHDKRVQRVENAIWSRPIRRRRRGAEVTRSQP